MDESRLRDNPNAFAIHYDGDVAEGHKWLGYAKVKLKFMLSNHAGAVSSTFKPDSGVEIQVYTRPNRIRIRAGGIVYVTYPDRFSTGDTSLPAYDGFRERRIIEKGGFIQATKPSTFHAGRGVSVFEYSASHPPFKGYWISGDYTKCVSWTLLGGVQFAAIINGIITPNLNAANETFTNPCSIAYKGGFLCSVIVQTNPVAAPALKADIFTLVDAGKATQTVTFLRRLTLITLASPSSDPTGLRGEFSGDGKTLYVITPQTLADRKIRRYVFNADFTSATVDVIVDISSETGTSLQMDVQPGKLMVSRVNNTEQRVYEFKANIGLVDTGFFLSRSTSPQNFVFMDTKKSLFIILRTVTAPIAGYQFIILFNGVEVNAASLPETVHPNFDGFVWSTGRGQYLNTPGYDYTVMNEERVGSFYAYDGKILVFCTSYYTLIIDTTKTDALTYRKYTHRADLYATPGSASPGYSFGTGADSVGLVSCTEVRKF